MAVSIHAPARGATVSPEQAAASIAGFNPRPCTRGDRFCRTGDGSVKVSIHAPARGATVWDKNFRAAFSVSIHAPARGATRIKPYTSERRRQVSIHAPARGATGCADRHGTWPLVSIHAPARGATVVGAYGADGFGVSIHAPARGATDPQGIPGLDQAGFNPRPCTRGDATTAGGSAWPTSFQSTPLHEGRREPSRSIRGVLGVSIHAPARGATILQGFFPPEIPVSIHAPARGATNLDSPHLLSDEVSIHAPARGATGFFRVHAFAKSSFNPRPCTRGDC